MGVPMTAMRAAFLVQSCLLVAGCKSPAEQFTDDFCDIAAPCCGQVGLPTGGALCHRMFGQPAGTTFNAAAADACLAGIHARKEASSYCWPSPPISCYSVFDYGGTAEPGASCTHSSDCSSRTNIGVECLMNTCVVVDLSGVGPGPCFADFWGDIGSPVNPWPSSAAAHMYECDRIAGAFCDPDTYVCSPLRDVGDACASDAACKDGEWCNLDLQCAAKGGLNDLCGQTDAACLDAYSCYNGACQPRLAPGEYCLETGRSCPVGYQCSGGVCERVPSLPLTGVCGD